LGSSGAEGSNVAAAFEASSSEDTARDRELQDAYARATARIEEYRPLARKTIASNKEIQRELRAALSDLDAALHLKPDYWPAWWARGKAEQLLSQHEAAYQAFHRAYGIERGRNADVGRELVLECLETGRGPEAVSVAEQTTHAEPQNPGLKANLALAYLINGQNDDAARAASEAMGLDPEDEVTASAARAVQDVRAGKRPKPHRMSDLLPQ
jgi:tetratricopeptide (TPR) repeat protein